MEPFVNSNASLPLPNYPTKCVATIYVRVCMGSKNILDPNSLTKYLGVESNSPYEIICLVGWIMIFKNIYIF